jgi:GDP-L-fucose synthase
MDKNEKILVLGGQGLVGSSICRQLKKSGYTDVITSSFDLKRESAVKMFFNHQKPDYVFLAAAKVGGIAANDTYPAEFIYDNLMIQTNVINVAYQTNVKKILLLGSSCIYPRLCPQPIKEEYFLTGPLEETNKSYAVAKIAGIQMIQAYRKQYGFNGICLMPTNLYGQNDHYDLEKSHVLPALIRKIHEAKIHNQPSVLLWGNGEPKREFMYVDDLADAAIFLMNTYNSSDIINVGTGKDVTIRELAEIIKKTVGYTGGLEYDTSRPNGTPQKLLDLSKLHNLGWQHKIELEEGISKTYQHFLKENKY